MGTTFLMHSAKGSTWEKHKYVKVIDGVYFYPDSYEGGRHLDSDKAKELMSKAANFAVKGKSGSGKSNSSAKESLASKKKGGSGSGSGKASEAKAEEKPKHVVKEAIDSKDKKAVQKRINESLGRAGKVNVKPKGGGSSSSKKETSEEVQNLAEQYVNDLEDAKVAVEDLRVDYQTAEKEDKAALKKQLTSAQAELKKIRNKIKIKSKNNKELRKIINELTRES